MHTILVNSMFVVITFGFIAYMLEKNTLIKKLVAEIEAEPIKYNGKAFDCCSVSYNFIGRIILLGLIGVIISVPVLYFMNNPNYGMMSLIIIILFLALINFTPYYITIKNEKIYYRHLINTLNRTITIPLSKLDRMTYWEDTSIKKVLSLIINNNICIDINVLFINNYEEIAYSINHYIDTREEVVTHNTMRYYDKEKNVYTNEPNKRIKVRNNNDYILLMIVLLTIEGLAIFSFFTGAHDIATITGMLVIPLIILRLVPYKICFYGDRIELKHLIHTRNQIKTIFTNDISHIDIVAKTSSFTTSNNNHMHRTMLNYYTLNIYKKDQDIISLNLLYENMGDIQQIADIINRKV